MSREQPPIVIHRRLDASAAEVFAAWTDPGSVQQWMCPGPGVTLPRVEMDLRVGGAFRIDMQSTQGVVTHAGVYQEITPPTRLVFTWRSVHTGDHPTLVTLELREAPGGVELVLTHARLPDAPSAQQHKDGWSAIVTALAAWLA